MRNLVGGNVMAREVDPLLQAAADQYTGMLRISNIALAVVAVATALVAAYLVLAKIRPALRARNQVELVVEIILTLCSTFAVFVTIGIVLSVLFESIRFFQQVPFFDFFLASNGARRWRCGPIRSAVQAASAPFRSWPAPFSSPESPWSSLCPLV